MDFPGCGKYIDKTYNSKITHLSLSVNQKEDMGICDVQILFPKVTDDLLSYLEAGNEFSTRVIYPDRQPPAHTSLSSPSANRMDTLQHYLGVQTSGQPDPPYQHVRGWVLVVVAV